MLLTYRRLWILFAAFMLSLPMAVGLISPGQSGTSLDEQRVLAPLPPIPRSLAQWSALPPQLNAFLADRFGLRQRLIRVDSVIRHYYLDSGNDLVFIGRDGSLFYRGDHLLQSSAGIDVRYDRIDVTADLLATMHMILAARGIKFLVAPPPNSATIYPERLPAWLRRGGRTTEYDLLVSELEKRGVPVIDLRTPLLVAKIAGTLFWRYDSHWTPLGAVVGFNALVQAAGLTDWGIYPAAVLGPISERSDGDLARMLDLSGWLRESGNKLPQPVVASYSRLASLPFPPFAVTARHPVPTVLILGDSFTGGLFIPLVLRRAGRYIWAHHESCGFDWKWIDEFHPDFVWYMPTERLIPCAPGIRPKRMPTVASASVPAALNSDLAIFAGD